MSGDFTWTDERLAYASRRFAEGASFTVIANELGGVTRSAVGGKLARNGIKRGNASTPRYPSDHLPSWRGAPLSLIRSENAKTQAAIRRLFKPKEARAPKVLAPPKPANQSWPAKILADLSNSGECRMPRQSPKIEPGEAADTPYCAAPTDQGETYCTACHKIMFKREVSDAQQAANEVNAAKARQAKAMKARAAA